MPPPSVHCRPVLICEMTADQPRGRLVAANPSARQLLGFAPDHPPPSEWVDLLDPPVHWTTPHPTTTTPTPDTTTVDADTIVADTTCRARDTQRLPVTLEASRFNLHGHHYLVILLKDTRPGHDADLHTAIRDAIVQSSDDAIIGTTLDGTIISWNSGAQRLYGYPADQVIGKSFSFIIPPDRRKEMQRILDQRRRGQRIEHLETIRQHRDGSLVDVSLTVSPVTNRQGRIIGASSIGRDITERKRLQKQIAQAQIEKQLQIGAELHDGLGQSVTAIGMLARSLQRRLQSLAPAEAQTAGTIVDGIRNMETQLRALSKGLMPVSLDKQGLGAALEELAQQSTQRYHLPCKLRRRDVAVDDNLAATQLFRIAQEAVHNAARHAKPRMITITLRRNRRQTELSIEDDGRGLDPTAEPTHGLGMQIMRYRAAMIGATLTITARRTGGTVVRCALPSPANAPPQPANTPPHHATPETHPATPEHDVKSSDHS